MELVHSVALSTILILHFECMNVLDCLNNMLSFMSNGYYNSVCLKSLFIGPQKSLPFFWAFGAQMYYYHEITMTPCLCFTNKSVFLNVDLASNYDHQFKIVSKIVFYTKQTNILCFGNKMRTQYWIVEGCDYFGSQREEGLYATGHSSVFQSPFQNHRKAFPCNRDQ